MQFLTGGPIITMGRRGVAEAVAVDDGRIRAIGEADDVLAHRRRGDDVVDLGGAALLPGFVEPHTHPDLGAQVYSWVDVSGFTHGSVVGVEQALRAAVGERDPGQWIFAFGLDPMLTPDLGTWDRHRLDAISAEHPIVVMLQSMHTVYVNSAALAAAGVDETTPDPPGGGHYARDGAGHPTGRVAEQPAILPFAAFDLPTPERMQTRLRDQLDRYRRVGITTIGVAGSFFPLSTIREAAEHPAAPIRTTAYLRHDDAELSSWVPGGGHDRFRVQGVKLWYDGSPYTGTMLLDEPYLPSDLCCCTLGIPEGTVGQANFEPPELVDLLRTLGHEGWQVLTHAQGDRGSREMLDLYEQALDDTTPADHRWRLEHCALTTGGDLRRARRLGVSPSFHVEHVRHYGPELAEEILGADRAARLMPVGTAVEAGHRVSLHADSPMYPPGPLALAQTAVTRRTRLGTRLAPEQAIARRQALAAITIDAAWQLRMDDEVGSIEPGKRADFTVLDADPLATPAEDFDQINVLETWLDGRPAPGT